MRALHSELEELANKQKTAHMAISIAGLFFVALGFWYVFHGHNPSFKNIVHNVYVWAGCLMVFLLLVTLLLKVTFRHFRLFLTQEMAQVASRGDYYYRHKGLLKTMVEVLCVDRAFADIVLRNNTRAFKDFWQYKEYKQPSWVRANYVDYLLLCSQHNSVALPYMLNEVQIPHDTLSKLRMLTDDEDLICKVENRLLNENLEKTLPVKMLGKKPKI